MTVLCCIGHSRLSLLASMIACKRKVSHERAERIHVITRDTAETACVWELAQELHSKMDYGSAVAVGRYFERLVRVKQPDFAGVPQLARWEKDKNSALAIAQVDQLNTPKDAVFNWEWAQKHMTLSNALAHGAPIDIDITVWTMKPKSTSKPM